MPDTTKADLRAANEEVKGLMSANAALKLEAQTAYQRGYRDALQATENLARIVQSQGGIIAYLMQMLISGMKSDVG